MKNMFACLVLVWFAGMAAATPQRDAVFIADLHLSDEVIKDLRSSEKRLLVRGYKKPLGEIGVRILDEHKFAQGIPDRMTDPTLNAIRAKIADNYLSDFPPNQLVEIVAFHRSEAGAEVRRLTAVKGYPKTSNDGIEKVALPDIVFEPKSDLVNQLSAAHRAAYEDFLLTDAGTALMAGYNTRGTRVAVTVFANMSVRPISDADIYVQYVADILKTDGVALFPNRVARAEIIEKLRRDIEDTPAEEAAIEEPVQTGFKRVRARKIANP